MILLKCNQLSAFSYLEPYTVNLKPNYIVYILLILSEHIVPICGELGTT